MIKYLNLFVCFIALLSLGVVMSCSKIEERKPNRNPNPKEIIKIPFEVKGISPGYEIWAVAGYQVVDEECLPIDFSRAFGGVRMPSIYRERIDVNKLDAGRFEFEVVSDFYLKEYLYIDKLCEWKLSTIAINFGKDGLVRGSGISVEGALSKSSVTEYCDIDRKWVEYEPCRNYPRENANEKFEISIN